MVEYNLIRNGILRSLTSAGTGDISLTFEDIALLTDNNLTSGGVTISSGVLYLEAGLSQRIQVDGIRLYADDLTKSSNIKFYYKDEESDPYTINSTQVGSYYYTDLPDPSAPRSVLVTVSGINIDLYEFQVFNDDYIVAFGEDGTQTNQFLGDTPIGEESDPQLVALYNNESDALTGADSYTVVDYTGNDADQYIKISSSQNGTYFGVNDGALIEDNLVNSDISWYQGTFNNTQVSLDTVIVTPPATSQAAASSFSTIPFTSYTRPYCSWNTLLYNGDDDVVYFVSRDGNSLWLWEYEYHDNTWSTVSELRPGPAIHQANVAVAVYLNGYVYVISRVDVDTYAGAFFRYDVNGVQDNYEDLPAPPAFAGFSYNAAADRISMCTDGVKYIYIATLDQENTNTTTGRNFDRYDTTTSGWTSLSNSYDNQVYYQSTSTAMFGVQMMAYDTDRDVIYMFSMDSNYYDRSDPPYLSRYHVGSNTWSNAFIRLDSGGINVLKGTNLYHNPGGMCYHDDWLYFGPDPEVNDNMIVRYNIATTVEERINVGHHNYNVTGVSDYRDHEGYAMLAFTYSGTVYKMITNLNSHRNEIWRSPQTGVGPITIIDDGTYTTPIFELEDIYDSSYFITDGTAVSGSGNISYDENVYNGSIRVKSSDAEPITIDEVYIAYSNDDIQRWIPYTNSYTAPWKSINDGYSSLTAYATAVNRKNGNVALSIRRNYVFDHSSRLYIYNRSGSELYSLWSPSNDWSYALATFMQFDIDGGIWGYGDFSGSYNDRHLYHFDYSLSIDADISDGTDFFYLGAADINGTGLWYTNSTENVLYHLNRWGTVTHTIPLNTPRWLCGTLDNGCWVNDTTAGTMIRYDEDGNLVKTVSVGFNASAMCHDYNNGAWIRTGYDIYHMTSNGVIDAGPTTLTNSNRLEPSRNGVYVVRTSSPDTVWFLNHEGAIEKTRSLSSSSRTVYGAFSYSIEDALEFKSAGLIPASYDPVWGTGGSLEWQEVRKDGYFLPKVKYHRTETTLRGDAVLEKIIMPPAINVQDIPPDDYKYIYLKTDIPLSADIKDYEGKLRTWWGVVD